MDELLIEDRRYISSKRAAEITGYAKDYIGQLCRGGYVPAKRVGRNWYVLESGIKDHRFGNASEEKSGAVVPHVRAELGVRENATPRYEVMEATPLLAMHDDRRAAAATVAGRQASDDTSHSGHDLQEVWQAWFEQFRSPEFAVPDKPDPAARAEPDLASEAPLDSGFESSENQSFQSNDSQEPKGLQQSKDSKRVSLIRYTDDMRRNNQTQAPRREAGVRTSGKGIFTARPMSMKTKEKRRRHRRALNIIAILFFVLIVLTTIAGTGFFDKYAISDKRVGQFAGVSFYKKH